MAETSIKTPDGTFSAYVAAPKNLAAARRRRVSWSSRRSSASTK
jgi:hypothetical protein